MGGIIAKFNFLYVSINLTVCVCYGIVTTPKIQLIAIAIVI